MIKGSVCSVSAWVCCLRYFVVATVVFLQSGELRAQTPDFAQLGKSVVSIRVERGKGRPSDEAQKETGTGILMEVNPGVLRFLTAAHVVKDAATIEIRFSTDHSLVLPARALPDSSDSLDLAVLEAHISGPFHLPANLRPLGWSAKRELKTSEHVWTLNGDGEPVPNNIVRLSHSGNPQQFEYTQVSVGEGYSGAPVFDDNGSLIGIHDEETSRSDYKLSVAVKIEPALETLDALGYPTQTMNALVENRSGAGGAPAVAAPAQAFKAPSSTPATTATTPTPAAASAQLWRSTQDNQMYRFRLDGQHLYIARRDGTIVADLALTHDKKGFDKYAGNSSLSNCPGSGYTEIVSLTASRVEGRVEQKLANGNCGGLIGFLRQMAPISFIPEP